MSSDRLESLAELFSKLKFRRKVIGGISEADVWKKLEEVQTEYRRLYDLQAAGYEARLKEREDRIHTSGPRNMPRSLHVWTKNNLRR